jgi:hypothetical protein
MTSEAEWPDAVPLDLEFTDDEGGRDDISSRWWIKNNAQWPPIILQLASHADASQDFTIWG